MEDLLRSLKETTAYLKSRAKSSPRIGIVLGTGLGRLAREITPEISFPYEEIPNFVRSTVEGHAGRLLFGTLGGKTVVAMQGRFHFYEGYSMQEITFPIRVMKALGCRTLLLSNAAGGLNPFFRKGDLMIIVDHINLLGDNPLRGPNIDKLGSRWPDMCDAYDPRLIELTQKTAVAEKVSIKKGVYVAVAGPNLETRAEYRFLRICGADAVGMSTVPEVIAARHMGMRVLALSIITDLGLPDALAPVDIKEIIRIADKSEPILTRIVKRVVEQL